MTKGETTGSGAAHRWKLLLAVAGLIVLTAVVHWPALRAGFIWDDDDHLTANPADDRARRSAANLVVPGGLALLSADADHLLVRTSIVGPAPDALPRRQHRPARAFRRPAVFPVARMVRAGRLRRGDPLGGAPGQCRVRRLDHGNEEHAIRRVLLSLAAVLRRLLAATADRLVSPGVALFRGGAGQQTVDCHLAAGAAARRLVATRARGTPGRSWRHCRFSDWLP